MALIDMIEPMHCNKPNTCITCLLPRGNELTHCGQATQICISKIIIVGSDNGFSPSRRQAIIWTNAGVLFIGPFGINFSEILIKINIFSIKKMPLKMLSAKCRLFRLGLNELTTVCIYVQQQLCLFRYDDVNIKCLFPYSAAYEVLGIPVKRRSYDSVDPEFDDTVPPSNQESKDNFYDTFKSVFEANARWEPPHSEWYNVGIMLNIVDPLYTMIIFSLTHCGLVTPYDGRDLGQHWLR